MNPLYKIISGLIVTLNRLIDSLDKRTIDAIKQTYYLIVVFVIAIGVYIGYSGGKGAAKKYGKPLATYTDEVFETYIKKERDDIRFSSMLENEIVKERKNQELKKNRFPSNIEFKSESSSVSDILIEPDKTENKRLDLPSSDSRDRIAEIKRLDKPKHIESVKELDKEMLSPIDKSGSYIVK